VKERFYQLLNVCCSHAPDNEGKTDDSTPSHTTFFHTEEAVEPRKLCEFYLFFKLFLNKLSGE